MFSKLEALLFMMLMSLIVLHYYVREILGRLREIDVIIANSDVEVKVNGDVTYREKKRL